MSKENRKFGIGLCANSAFCDIPQSTQEKTKSVHHDAHYVESASNSRIYSSIVHEEQLYLHNVWYADQRQT
jgi:hypothetical protein